MRLLKKVVLIIIFVLPFCIGTIGYYMDHETVFDAMYGAFALYAVNPVYDSKNILIEIARWMAPIVLASGLLLVLREIVYKFKYFFYSFFSDAIAIYCDNDFGDTLIKNVKHGILVKNDTVRDVDNHIIMYSEDEKNLKFYYENKQKLESKNVFIKSETIDSFKANTNDVKFFNINEIIAATYWKERNLIRFYKNGNLKIRIAIIGFDQLGQKILTSGIQNNIYSLNQRIEYHVWGDSTLYKNLHSNLQLMNDDAIVYHSGSWKDDINLISGMERIIITENDMELVTSLQELCSDSEIECCDPDKKIFDVYQNNCLHIFGQYEDALTEENIKTDNLYYFAKKLNYKYACLYGKVSESPENIALDAEWNKINGFTKGSNIASASYHSIRLLIMQKNNTMAVDDELAEMEHIRWCRYHFLNHWKYGQTIDSKKDSIDKIHPCLVPFKELTRADKDKDIEAIKVLLELKSGEE